MAASVSTLHSTPCRCRVSLDGVAHALFVIIHINISVVDLANLGVARPVMAISSQIPVHNKS